MTQDENAAAGVQTQAAAQQRTRTGPDLKRGKWVFVVTLRVSFEGWLVVRRAFEVMQVSELQCLDQTQAQVPLEWFLVF